MSCFVAQQGFILKSRNGNGIVYSVWLGVAEESIGSPLSWVSQWVWGYDQSADREHSSYGPTVTLCWTNSVCEGKFPAAGL